MNRVNHWNQTLEIQIRKTILRRFGCEILKKSNLFHSNRLSMDIIIEGFPDDQQIAAEEIVLKMCDEFILSSICADEVVYYYVNPNKQDLVKNIYNSINLSYKPPEESIPYTFKKVFETNGTRTTKGFITRYLFYTNPEESGHFYVFIKSSVHGKPDKRYLGSIANRKSILGETWFAINEKLDKNTFYKFDLQALISNRNIIGNNQPLKAAIDVLEFLQLISKTGKRIRRSEEYTKTGKQPVDARLDKFL